MSTTRRSLNRGRTGHGSGSRTGGSRSSSRAALIPVSANDDAESGFRSRRPPPTSNRKGQIIALVIVVICVIAALSYMPAMRWFYLNRIDKAEGAEAIAAANDYLNFTDRNPQFAWYAISCNRGVFEAQVHMATESKSFEGMMTIARRLELTPVQLSTALSKGLELYKPEQHENASLPVGLEEWAQKHADRDVAIAAIRLLAARNENKTAQLLSEIARVRDQDPPRITAALDGLAAIAEPGNLGYILGLLSAPVADQVMSHPALRPKIVDLANVDQLVRFVELLSHELPGVRALALDSLGGPRMSLSDKPEHAKRRQELGERITGKLAVETPPIELAAALRAVNNLRLNGARDAVLKLVPIAPTLTLPGIDNKFLSATLGARFIFSEPESARDASEELLGKLSAALDDPASREIAANALSLVTDPTFRGLRPGLDKLASYGDDPVCFNALITLVNKTFQRADVVKANGNSLDQWKSFLNQDRPRYDRFQEIYSWYLENQKFQRVSDGKVLLGKNKDYIFQASEQINAWREDPKFVPPLGLSKDQISDLANDLNMLGMSVRKAWSGALD